MFRFPVSDTIMTILCAFIFTFFSKKSMKWRSKDVQRHFIQTKSTSHNKKNHRFRIRIKLQQLRRCWLRKTPPHWLGGYVIGGRMMCAWGSHLIEVHQLDHAVELEGVGEAVLASLVANLHQLVRPSLHGNLKCFPNFFNCKTKKGEKVHLGPGSKKCSVRYLINLIMIVTLDLSECGVLGRRKCIVTNNLDHKYVPVPVPLNLSECEGVLSAPGGGNVPNNLCICTPWPFWVWGCTLRPGRRRLWPERCRQGHPSASRSPGNKIRGDTHD